MSLQPAFRADQETQPLRDHFLLGEKSQVDQSCLSGERFHSPDDSLGGNTLPELVFVFLPVVAVAIRSPIISFTLSSSFRPDDKSLDVSKTCL